MMYFLIQAWLYAPVVTIFIIFLLLCEIHDLNFVIKTLKRQGEEGRTADIKKWVALDNAPRGQITTISTIVCMKCGESDAGPVILEKDREYMWPDCYSRDTTSKQYTAKGWQTYKEHWLCSQCMKDVDLFATSYLLSLEIQT